MGFFFAVGNGIFEYGKTMGKGHTDWVDTL